MYTSCCGCSTFVGVLHCLVHFSLHNREESISFLKKTTFSTIFFADVQLQCIACRVRERQSGYKCTLHVVAVQPLLVCCIGRYIFPCTIRESISFLKKTTSSTVGILAFIHSSFQGSQIFFVHGFVLCPLLTVLCRHRPLIASSLESVLASSLESVLASSLESVLASSLESVLASSLESVLYQLSFQQLGIAAPGCLLKQCYNLKQFFGNSAHLFT